MNRFHLSPFVCAGAMFALALLFSSSRERLRGADARCSSREAAPQPETKIRSRRTPAPPLPPGMTGSTTNDPRVDSSPACTTPARRRWA